MAEKTENQILEEILFELQETRKYKKNVSTNTGIIAIILVFTFVLGALGALSIYT